jgi:hypothetical protein
MITKYVSTEDVTSYLGLRPDRVRGAAPHFPDVLVLQLASSVRPLPDWSWCAEMARPIDTHPQLEFLRADFPNSSSEGTIRICPDDLTPLSDDRKGLVSCFTHLQVHQLGAGTCPGHLSSTSDYGV